MTERQPDRSTKKGVRGWRAFFLVFGSGTIAALLVFGIIIGGLRLFVSFATDDPKNDSDGAAAPTRGPVSSLEPGSFDLCESIENMSSFTDVSPERVDDGERFKDTAEEQPNAASRKIKNDCEWTVRIGGMNESKFRLRYQANAGGDDARKDAVKGFRNEKKKLSDGLDRVTNEDKLGSFKDGDYYVYGESEGGERFKLAGLVKNSVFVMDMETPRKEQSSTPKEGVENDYRALVRKMSPDIRERLDRVVPD